MKLSYNGLALDNLGEFTVTQQREYEDGQRVKVTLRVGVTLFERSYADNYALVSQLQEALLTQNAVMCWENDDTGTDYVNQTVTLQSSELPEEWGSYQMPFVLVFNYYEQGLITNNLPMTFAPTGGKPLTLGNVAKFAEAASTERFSPFHSQRVSVKGEVTVSGWLLVDTTLALADRRVALTAAKAALMTALASAQGLLQFGAAGAVFNRMVRPERSSVEIDQLLSAVNWSFTASYSIFPNEANFATVDYQAEEKDPETGEEFLTLTGKITATDEPTARAKLAVLIPAACAQYGYVGDNVVQMRNDATPRIVDANQDGVTFTELSFTIEFKTWRTDNQEATFIATGETAPVPIGNVRTWEMSYQARRFNDMRSQRQRAGGTLSASGTFAGNPADTLADRRAALLAAQRAMLAEVNGADGLLEYGAFSQVVRVDEFRANINQAISGIDWTMTASYTLFPNESGYATCEWTATPRTDNETGEQILNVSGRIFAPDESLARAKLALLLAKVAQEYGFTAAQVLRQDTKVNSVYANGDQTETLAGLEDETEGFEGATFIELSFEQEYRSRMATLLSWTMQASSKSEGASGLVQTTFSGSVTAGGEVGAAYDACVAKAQWLATRGALQLGGAVKLSEHLNWDTRQVTATGIEEGVRLNFTFEYQGKLGAGWAQIQVTTESTYTAIGVDTTGVSGAVVAVDEGTARMLYAALVRGSYDEAMVTEERIRTAAVQFQMPAELGGTTDLAQSQAVTVQYQITQNGVPVDLTGLDVTFTWDGEMLGAVVMDATEGQVAAILTADDTATAGTYQLIFTVGSANYGPLNYEVTATPTPGTMATQWLRLEYSFSVISPVRTGPAAGRYSLSVSSDYLTLTRRWLVRGSSYANTGADAKAFAETIIGLTMPETASVLRHEYTQDTEWNGDPGTGFTKLLKCDFEVEAVDKITGQTGVLECRVTETVKYSGTRWVIQPIPRDVNGNGGVSIVQDAGLTEGARTVKGSVTACDRATAIAWANAQQVFLGTDSDGNGFNQPPELETEYEFVPRTDGVAMLGAGEEGQINVRLWRVSFTFGEILPNYPAPEHEVG